MNWWAGYGASTLQSCRLLASDMKRLDLRAFYSLFFMPIINHGPSIFWQGRGPQLKECLLGLVSDAYYKISLLWNCTFYSC